MNWITRIAVKKVWITYLLTALIAGASIFAMLSLKQELIPDIEFPMVTVVTIYPQAPPEQILNEVTLPVESTIVDLPDLKHITSSSTTNTSVVYAEFEYGTDMDDIIATVTDRISKLDLPESVRNLPSLMPSLGQNPQVVPINIDSMPIATISLMGDKSVQELGEIAETRISPVLRNVPGVYDVSVTGIESEKILVTPSPEFLAQSGLTVAQLAGLIATGQYSSVTDIENIPLGNGLTVKNAADISLGIEPGAAINRTNGKPSVSIAVIKTAEANTVETANAVMEEIEKINQSLPVDVTLVTVNDQSTYIESSIANLTKDAFIGGILAIIVVFLFLMAIRASLIMAISIPMSVLIGFLIMYFANITINLLTLTAMTLAIGRVIDDSIVMVEVIHHRMEGGEHFPQAAIRGAGEIINSITSATIATVIIFIPLGFIGGIVGELFLPFALTITFTMLGSLLSALTIVPALTRVLNNSKQKISTVKRTWYQGIYSIALRWCLAHRAATIIISVALFLGSISLIPLIGTSFMPELKTNAAQITIAMPEDADISALLETVDSVEAVLLQNNNIASFSTTIGSSQNSFAVLLGGAAPEAEIFVNTVENVKTELALEEIKNSMNTVATTGTIEVQSLEASVMGASSSFELSIRGDNMEDITAISRELSDILGNISGVSKVEVVAGKTQSQVIITADPAKLMASGMMSEVSTLQGELMLLQQGGTAGATTINTQPYPIYINSVTAQTEDINILNKLQIGTTKTIALGDIATIAVAPIPTQYLRVDQKLAATISGIITQKNVGAVNGLIQEAINDMNLPEGLSIGFSGVTEEMAESFNRMYLSIIIAVVLSYLVLLITFRSFIKSLIVMITLPLAAIGAFVALAITGHTIGVVGLMGILMLVGIVLSNAIVLISYIDDLRKDGIPIKEAIIAGGERRLRPILMTALTTLIAMVPMALGIGEGVIVAAEMAVVVIGGLFSSTLLTLLVVPVVYSLISNRQKK